MRRERIVELPKIFDRRGNLSFVEDWILVPFKTNRAYWIYDVPGGQYRGSHAYRNQQELIIALSGSFDVVLDDGKEKIRYHLNRSFQGLYVPNLTWRSLENFSTNAVCLVIASQPYEEEDYIRNYRSFLRVVKGGTHKLYSYENRTEDRMESLAHTVDTNVYSVFDCSMVDLSTVKNKAGNITYAQGCDNIPFDIRRVFYIYDIPSGEKRGMHAHKHCHEILVAASGSFVVELDDGKNKKQVILNRPQHGLHIPPGIWATEKEYSSGAICLVLASDVYDAEDYISTYSNFKKYRSDGNKAI